VSGGVQGGAQVMQRTALGFGASAHWIDGRLGSKQRFENRQQLRILRLATGAPTAGGTDVLARTLCQSSLKFTPTGADRSAIQARDPGQQRLPATTDALGLKRNEPATLLLIKPADKQIDLLVQLSVRMRLRLSASGTPALMDKRGRHRQLQSWLVQRGRALSQPAIQAYSFLPCPNLAVS
jgi:hypothetical protein